MEEDQEFKYFCKLCSRSFPCGRSLGGHMKSHLINNSDDQKFVKLASDPQASYGLRENPKKTWRIADLSEDTSHYDAAADHKLCRECGKGFPSWKTLVLHMKCHSNSVTNSSENEQDSCTSAKVVDSQSENETTNTTTRRRRRTTSRKRRTRYMGTNTTATTTSSSNFSIANYNASSSVTEIEQEQQEEVALCLMMLSRDVSHWRGLKYVAHIDHSASDTNSEFSDDPSSFRTELIQGKLKKLDKKKKMIEEELSVGEFSKNDRLMNLVKKFNLPEAQFGSNNFNASNKRRKPQVGNDHNSPKSHKYECGTCNKVFKSYQALGGHRASHKKIKGCFASKIESSENTTEFDTDLSSDHHPSKLSSLIDHSQDVVVVKSEKSIIGTKSKGHCCLICSRVFPTGQALGGHKRSHAIVDSRNGQSNLVIPKPPPTPEVRDFLDLNLPAPVEEESSTSHAAASQAFKPWWVGSSHKPGALVS